MPKKRDLDEAAKAAIDQNDGINPIEIDTPSDSDDEATIVPVRMSKDFRKALEAYYKDKGLALSTGIRNTLYEMAGRERVFPKK